MDTAESFKTDSLVCSIVVFVVVFVVFDEVLGLAIYVTWSGTWVWFEIAIKRI